MPMEYADFYDIATYGNEAWKGSFTPKEVAQNAYDYLCEFEWSKANAELSHTMRELVRLLKEDGTEECLEWVERIEDEIAEADENM